jgi:hypothetical protein
LAEIARNEFPSILKEDPVLLPDRLRLLLADGSFLDIRYPTRNKYSFQWQGKDRLVRINTAEHHPHLSTFPRHVHFDEKTVTADNLTKLENSPEENLRSVLSWIRSELAKEK